MHIICDFFLRHILEITKATDKISRMHGQAISLSKNRAFVASLGFLLWLHKYCGGIYANNDFRVAREILRNIFEVNQFIHVCLISFFPMCICTFQQFFASISSFSSKIFLKKWEVTFCTAQFVIQIWWQHIPWLCIICIKNFKWKNMVLYFFFISLVSLSSLVTPPSVQ